MYSVVLIYCCCVWCAVPPCVCMLCLSLCVVYVCISVFLSSWLTGWPGLPCPLCRCPLPLYILTRYTLYKHPLNNLIVMFLLMIRYSIPTIIHSVCSLVLCYLLCLLSRYTLPIECGVPAVCGGLGSIIAPSLCPAFAHIFC